VGGAVALGQGTAQQPGYGLTWSSIPLPFILQARPCPPSFNQTVRHSDLDMCPPHPPTQCPPLQSAVRTRLGGFCRGSMRSVSAVHTNRLQEKGRGATFDMCFRHAPKYT
jgi:hypothetical protein